MRGSTVPLSAYAPEKPQAVELAGWEVLSILQSLRKRLPSLEKDLGIATRGDLFNQGFIRKDIETTRVLIERFEKLYQEGDD